MENGSEEVVEESPSNPVDSTNYFKTFDIKAMQNFVACPNDQLRLEELQKLVHVNHYTENPRSEILVDLLFGICNFCVELFCLEKVAFAESKLEKQEEELAQEEGEGAMIEEKNDESKEEEKKVEEGYTKMLTIVSILAEVVESAFGGNIRKSATRTGTKILSSKESFTLLKKLLMAKCINNPDEGCEEILDMETVNKTVSFLSKTFFRYYNAYRYAFKYDQPVVEVERDVLVHMPLPPTPLSAEALTQELESNDKQKIQSMEETDINQNEVGLSS